MSDTLKIYGVTYTGVTSLNANDTNHANKKYVRPQGTKSISENGTGIDVTNYASVDVSVSGGNDFVITISYDSTSQMHKPDCTYQEFRDAYSSGKNIVVISGDPSAFIVEKTLMDSTMFDYLVVELSSYPALPIEAYEFNIGGTERLSSQIAYETSDTTATSTDVLASMTFYNGNGKQTGTIQTKTSSDLTASGATVTVPSGYYESQASKAVASGTAGTPTATKGTVDPLDALVTVTPSVTNTTGYITGGTNTGTAVTVTADELVAGNTMTADDGGDWTVARVETLTIPYGTATAPTSISGTSATISIGTNTLTFSKSISVTPRVTTQGWINSGTAGNSAVSLTASIVTKAAATYHPSTSAQTISASQYLTGAQTIAAVTTTNLSASNILSGVTIKVGDSSDDDCVASVTGNVSFATYYTGSSAPSSSLGVNGDIYLKTS